MGRAHRIRTLGFVILVCLLGFGSGDLRADEETASGIVRQINAAMKDGRVKRAVALLEGDHAKALLEHPPGAVAALRAVIGGLLSAKSPASRDLNALAAATRSLAAGVAEAVPDSLDQRRAAAYAAAVQARAQLQGAAVTAASLRRGAEPLGALFKEGRVDADAGAFAGFLWVEAALRPADEAEIDAAAANAVDALRRTLRSPRASDAGFRTAVTACRRLAEGVMKTRPRVAQRVLQAAVDGLAAKHKKTKEEYTSFALDMNDLITLARANGLTCRGTYVIDKEFSRYKGRWLDNYDPHPMDVVIPYSRQWEFEEDPNKLDQGLGIQCGLITEVDAKGEPRRYIWVNAYEWDYTYGGVDGADIKNLTRHIHTELRRLFTAVEEETKPKRARVSKHLGTGYVMEITGWAPKYGWMRVRSGVVRKKQATWEIREYEIGKPRAHEPEREVVYDGFRYRSWRK